MEPGAVVGVPEELESLLEAQGVLCGAVRCLDAAHKAGHLPLGLTGGRGQEGFVALVQGARPHRVRHRQHRDLPREKFMGSAPLEGTSHTQTHNTQRSQLKRFCGFEIRLLEKKCLRRKSVRFQKGFREFKEKRFWSLSLCSLTMVNALLWAEPE